MAKLSAKLIQVIDSYKTVAPEGLTISRNGLTFAFKWKINDKNYASGQQVQYRLNNSGEWQNIGNIKTTDTSTSLTLSAGDYYPTFGKPTVNMISFRVRGLRSKSSIVTSTKTVKKVLYSDWAEKSLALYVHAAPTVSAAWGGSSNPYSTSFTASTTVKTDDQYPFTRINWEAVLVKDCSETDGSKISFSGGTMATGSSPNASTTNAILEDSNTIVGANKSYTRWYRARVTSIAGASGWVYSKHVYATPNKPTVTAASINKSGNIPVVEMSYNTAESVAHPIDKTEAQYVITTPASGLTCPSGATWDTATTPKDIRPTGKTQFSLESSVGYDQCLWTRIKLTHDTNTNYSAPRLVEKGSLTSPSNLTVQVNQSNFQATVTATNGSAVPDSKLAIVFRQANNPSKDLIVGVINHGATSATVKCPNWTNLGAVAFGVYAFQGTASSKTRSDGVTQYTVTANMTSTTIWDGGAVPSAPTAVTASPSDETGEIIVTWKWAWSAADVAEVSWSQNANAWESTDEPDTYVITNLYDAQWRISNLETGVVWYIRIRLGQTNGDDITYGPYCRTVSVDLSSAPAVPVLVLSEGVISEKGSVTATWAYVTGDGTGQGFAEICEATVNANSITYGDIIAHTETAQKIVISARDVGWTSGNTYNLCVRVSSASGRRCDGWSAPVPVTVAVPPTCGISSTSLETITVTDAEEVTRQVLSLTEMPLEVHLSGVTNSSVIASVAIERALDYSTVRPDGTIFHGYEGETVALIKQTGRNVFTITADDLIGHLDDEAHYRIVATLQDNLGQTDSASLEFEVHWGHQAIVPNAFILVDNYNYIAVITPLAPEGTETGDVCDIYRLSADKPELIVKGAAWGTEYVDPYPAPGRFGGHRIVFRSKDGDYITADNQMAWIDLQESVGDYLEAQRTMIDFPGGRAELDYNLTLSNTWKKDFTETKYLGGAVQGDWNSAVSRTAKVDGIVVIGDTPEKIQIFRQLAVYPGICHVRTPEGSSFAADVQVSESVGYEDGAQTASFSLSITRVDAEELDGLTFEEWSEEEA